MWWRSLPPAAGGVGVLPHAALLDGGEAEVALARRVWYGLLPRDHRPEGRVAQVVLRMAWVAPQRVESEAMQYHYLGFVMAMNMERQVGAEQGGCHRIRHLQCRCASRAR